MNMQPGLLSSLLFRQNCVHFKTSLFLEWVYLFPSSSSVEVKTEPERNRSGQNRSSTARSAIENFYFARLDYYLEERKPAQHQTWNRLHCHGGVHSPVITTSLSEMTLYVLALNFSVASE